MAGYNGFAMSNNAVYAYETGEKPLSKWTKAEIMSGIEAQIKAGDIELQNGVTVEVIRRVPLAWLKENALYESSWHHTSSHFNKTKFYAIDTDGVSSFTVEKLESVKAQKKEPEPPQPEERWHCEFLEWSGTRNHPKATVCTADGVIRGNWFYFKRYGQEKKKSIYANGFRKINKLED